MKPVFHVKQGDLEDAVGIVSRETTAADELTTSGFCGSAIKVPA
jgi:hypothetical protein